MPRCFIAIPIPRYMWPQLIEVQNELSAHPKAAPWTMRRTPDSNLHITLQFLGEVSKTNIEIITATLDRLSKAFYGFTISLRGLNAFPSLQEPKAIYAAITDGHNEVITLSEQLSELLAPLHFPKESRPRTPHVTLARLTHRTSCDEDATWLEQWSRRSLGSIEHPQIALYESALHPSGSSYQIINQYPLSLRALP